MGHISISLWVTCLVRFYFHIYLVYYFTQEGQMKHYLFTSTTARYIWKSIATLGLFTLIQTLMLTYLLEPSNQGLFMGIYIFIFIVTLFTPLWLNRIHPKVFITKRNAVKPLPTFLTGYAIILLLNSILAYVLGAESYNIAQPNQDIIEMVVEHAIHLILPMTVFIAPIVEELIFREWLPKLFRNIGRKFKMKDRNATLGGFIIGSLFFTLLHMPAGLQGWVVYGGLSAVLAYVRYKFTIEASIMMHFYYNVFAMSLMLIGLA